MKKDLFYIAAGILIYSCNSDNNTLKNYFINPPNEYRPMPFWHINGNMTQDGIRQRLTEAKQVSQFGGVTVLPVSPGPQHPTGILCPGTSPSYLSEEYFSLYNDILKTSQEIGTEVILYDDIDFPSGSAGGKLQREYPQYTRKYLVKDEFPVKEGNPVSFQILNDSTHIFMAASALNIQNNELIDLGPFVKAGKLEWTAPKGKWRIMIFSCTTNANGIQSNLVDYMQPEAVSKLLEMTYNEYEKRFGKYLGNVITKTFYDDVGFVHQENTWTPAITKIFEEKYGKNPALYYPALYYDIGEETAQARIAFFDIRSELMAEGYVKQAAEWSEKRKLKSMGHPPENYSPNSVVAHGDILKYYRHSHIPLLDAIFYYGRGVHGFKQITSAADLGDKPVVGAELCGAFPADMDSLTMFKTTLEALVRGVNFVVPHGMWYDTDPCKVRIPPVISHENPLLANCLQRYNTSVARSCVMLQGGNRICDIAVLWPIASIQGGSYINRDATSGLPVANWVPEHVNHYQISNILTNQVRRDFTYIHPEDFCNGKVILEGKELKLNNPENFQYYKVLILPGGDVISAETLKFIRHYYANGGLIIATESLPSKSAEFGRDQEVQNMIYEIFSFNVSEQSIPPTEIWRKNNNGGQAVFLPQISNVAFDSAFAKLNLEADVSFEKELSKTFDIGYLNYTHKQKDGKNIYFITNTSDKEIMTTVMLRGDLKNVEYWYPESGIIEKAMEVETVKKEKQRCYTKTKIKIPMVASLFIVANN
jgi:hypothetical protein